MNYNKTELCKNCKMPVEKELPTRFHLQKMIEKFQRAVYGLEDLMVMYGKAGQRDVANKLRVDLDKLKDIYFNIKTLKGQR